MSEMVRERPGVAGTGMRPRPPVFLVGAPRSGTTLLYKALCLHRDAAWISNWVRRYPQVHPLSAFNRLAGRFPAQRRAVWFGADSNAYVFGARRPLAHRLFPMPVEGEPLFVRCGMPDEVPVMADEMAVISDNVPGGTAGMSGGTTMRLVALRRAFSAVNRYSGGPVLISKRIVNNRRIAELAEAFPGARFVHLVRDGRAVAYSLTRVDWWDESLVWWYGDSPRRWREEGGDPWEIAARHWPEELRAVDRGLAAVSPGDVMQLSYEQFIAEPQSILDEVARFAGLGADPSWRREINGISFNHSEGWRTHLDHAVLQRIEDLQQDRLRRHGYVA